MHGLRDVAAGLPVTADTLWRIYSMTKPVTSVAVLTLVEEGRLALDDPVDRYLPAFAEPRVYVGGTGENVVTRPATGPVRVRHLMTHTAGLTFGFYRTHPVDALYRAAGVESSVRPGADLAETVDLYASLPLQFDPGTEWNYSVASNVLGRLVEVVSGQPLDVFCAERIFGPLGMTDTGFHVATRRRAAWPSCTARRRTAASRRCPGCRCWAGRGSCRAAAASPLPPTTCTGSRNCCGAAANSTGSGCSPRRRWT